MHHTSKPTLPAARLALTAALLLACAPLPGEAPGAPVEPTLFCAGDPGRAPPAWRCQPVCDEACGPCATGGSNGSDCAPSAAPQPQPPIESPGEEGDSRHAIEVGRRRALGLGELWRTEWLDNLPRSSRIDDRHDLPYERQPLPPAP